MTSCHASGFGLAAVRIQQDRPKAFWSREMISAETSYHITKQELLAVVEALTTLQNWPVGQQTLHFRLCVIELLLKGMRAREAQLNRPALGQYMTLSRDTFGSYLYEEWCYWIEQQAREAAGHGH